VPKLYGVPNIKLPRVLNYNGLNNGRTPNTRLKSMTVTKPRQLAL